jgi:hypothetical protein
VNLSPYPFDPQNPLHWWFEECPPEELFSCWHYEYLRDCRQIVEKVLEWRKSNPEWKDPVRYIDADPGERLAYLFGGWPYERIIWAWPEKPYLEIDPKIRKLHLTIYGIQDKSFYRCLQAANGKPVSLFPIYDLALPTNVLKKQFGKFLKDERRLKGIDIPERRGRRKMRTTVRSDLKALGAYRLSCFGKMSQEKVIAFMAAEKRTLYKYQSALPKVVKRITAELAWFESMFLAGKFPFFR